jgi:hypothetical protein
MTWIRFGMYTIYQILIFFHRFLEMFHFLRLTKKKWFLSHLIQNFFKDIDIFLFFIVVRQNFLLG